MQFRQGPNLICEFKEAGESNKHPSYAVRCSLSDERVRGLPIGFVRWDNNQQGYLFYPPNQTVQEVMLEDMETVRTMYLSFSSQELKEIAEFLDVLNNSQL